MRELSDDKSKRYPMRLEFVIGMPISYTSNETNPFIPLRNGSLGRIMAIEQDPPDIATVSAIRAYMLNSDCSFSFTSNCLDYSFWV